MDPIRIFYLIFRPAPKQTTLFASQDFCCPGICGPTKWWLHHNDSPQVPYLSTGSLPFGIPLKSDVVVAWLCCWIKGSGTLVGHSHTHHLLVCWMLIFPTSFWSYSFMPEPRSLSFATGRSSFTMSDDHSHQQFQVGSPHRWWVMSHGWCILGVSSWLQVARTRGQDPKMQANSMTVGPFFLENNKKTRQKSRKAATKEMNNTKQEKLWTFYPWQFPTFCSEMMSFNRIIKAGKQIAGAFLFWQNNFRHSEGG